MELRLRDSHNIIDSQFGQWLVQRVKIKLLSNVSKYNFINWDLFLTESEDVIRLYDRTYTASEIILFASNNIVCTSVPNELIITFNDTKFVPGFDRLRLSTIIRTINYGTLSVKGCPIFSDTLRYFEENIDLYVKLYYRI